MTANCPTCQHQSDCSSLDQQKEQAKPTDCQRYDRIDGGILGERNWT